MFKKIIYSAIIFSLLWSCNSSKNLPTKLRFIGEQVIPGNKVYNNTKVGGLSSIEYVDGKYYAISDDKDKPVRFYEMALDYNAASFTKVTITNVISIENNTIGLDPESLRYDKKTNHFLWTSEGNSRKNIDPIVFEITKNGKAIKTHITPNLFQAKYNSKTI